MSLKIYQVSWATPISHHDYCELFLSKREAENFAEKKIKGNVAIDVRFAEVTDIWHYTAKNFGEKIALIIESRTDNDNNTTMYDENDVCIVDELEEAAAEAGLEDFSCDCWCTFENSGIEVYALSCAWTYRDELHHFTETLEVF